MGKTETAKNYKINFNSWAYSVALSNTTTNPN